MRSDNAYEISASDAPIAAARTGEDISADAGHELEVALELSDYQSFRSTELNNSWRLFAIEAIALVLCSVATGLAYHSAQVHVPVYMAQLAATGVLIAIVYCSSERNIRVSAYPEERRKLGEFLRKVLCWCGSFLVLNFFAFAFHIAQEFSRGAVLSFFLTGLPVALLSRHFAARMIAPKLYSKSLRQTEAVIVGSSEHVMRATAGTMMKRGCVAPSQILIDAKSPAETWPLELRRVVRRTVELAHKANRGSIYVCAEDFPRDRLQKLLDDLKVIPRSVRVLPDVQTAQLLSHRLRNEIGGVSLEIQRAPLTEAQQFIKRSVDVVASSLLIAFFLPLFVAVAIAIKLDSRGPVLFRQARLGYRGQPFKIFKFRSMNVLEDGPEVKQATKKDPRITRVGYYLRQTNFDELPQLFNVFRGEMSLVGPRPHAVAHDEFYGSMIPNYQLRQHVVPGMTGWAQVSGFRGETPTTDLMWRRVEHDLWYAKNASLALDFEIFLRTIALGLGLEPDISEARQIRLFNGKLEEFLTALTRRTDRARIVVTPNVDHYRLLTRSSAFQRAYLNADFVVNDSRLLDGIALKGSVLCAPGSDFVPSLIVRQPAGRKICVFGYTEAVKAFLTTEFPHLDFSFLQPSMGYIRKRDERRQFMRADLAIDPDILLVCTGAPRSEIFANQVKEKAQSKALIVCCGSALEFLAGSKQRAPSTFRGGGLEWLWRFLREPHTRLRYVADSFFLLVSAISIVQLRYGRRGHFKGFSILKK